MKSALSPKIRSVSPALENPVKGLDDEWFEFDGLGGFASSTVALCPSRRYHGLLVTPPEGHAKRHVFLSRFEEALDLGGERFYLSSPRYPGAVPTPGLLKPESFSTEPWTSFVFRQGKLRITREILTLPGKRAVLCRYRIEGGKKGDRLELRPLMAFREADALTFENLALDTTVKQESLGFSVQPYKGLPRLWMSHGGSKAAFEVDPLWYGGLEYREDIARGYDGIEDLWQPGVLRLDLRAKTELILAASIEERIENPAAVWKAECKRRKALQPKKADLRTGLASRAKDFLYRSQEGRLGVIAGYPWFGEWGRDTYLSLPGLTLARGDLESCEEILLGALDYLDKGMLPNIFGLGREDSHYGSADASLWFVRALRLWEQAGANEEKILVRFLPALVEIATWYRDGTGLGIHATEDGLLHVGAPGLNPTWMDAQCSTGPVTPRDGFPIEMNALWYFLLTWLETLLKRSGDAKQAAEWGALRKKCGKSFIARFWLTEGNYLADNYNHGKADRSIRPNMVLAAALEFSPLTKKQRQGVMAQAKAHLVTSRGLRTLSPQDPAYRPTYSGGWDERDSAYHQGTVWPWLMGFYCEAMLRAKAPTKAQLQELKALLEGIEPHLEEAGRAQISEVFDADAPHRPGGTPAQAWSLAEWLRALVLVQEAQG